MLCLEKYIVCLSNNEFIKLGMPAEDYDIKNDFSQTDNVIDLFDQIEKAYEGKESVFDNITPDDLTVSFFPCIRFCEASNIHYSFSEWTSRHLSTLEKIEKIIRFQNERTYLFNTLLKMFHIYEKRGLKLIFENPYQQQSYLHRYFPYKAKVIDKDRTKRGDDYKKPTAYWFLNIEPKKCAGFIVTI